jgi:hypothetical protein
MFGLEGSGFTICLGIILLLTGVVMYYCKSKISQCEQKMNSMMSLITGLHQEINHMKSQHIETEIIDERIQSENYDNQLPVEEEEDEDEDEEESDSSSEDEEPEVETKTASSFLNHPYSELIPTSGFNQIEVNESSESEDDEEQQSVKVVDLGEIEELSVPLEEDISQIVKEPDESVHSDDSDESDESDESEEVATIDYSKMQVAALKKLATERQLASNVSKMRKQELVELLQGH